MDQMNQTNDKQTNGQPMNARIFVEKRKPYDMEATHLREALDTNFSLSLSEIRCINVYDVFQIETSLLEQAKHRVFSEVMVDDVAETLDVEGYVCIAYECLPGQYDQRADSAKQCINLIDSNNICVVRSSKVVLLKGDISSTSMELVRQYLINTVECREKDISLLTLEEHAEILPMAVYDDFIDLDQAGLEHFRTNHQSSHRLEDLLHIQAYYKTTEHRNPTETELKVLETYWSDHCRHTTFETALTNVVIEDSKLKQHIEAALSLYLAKRTTLSRQDKDITLMDMATIAAKYARQQGMLQQLEVSDEINACSIHIEVDHNGVKEPWLLMFKNETHNHPTEIEPFGGASTCIGGAIRDPLSGRSYVFQAMRISGSGNVLADINQTLPHKLPQQVISTKATQGNASYGNQIGLATTFVKELFDDGFVAKHMECGVVVGANKTEYVVRKDCAPNDRILLLGGRTGRDGIGGATGSSKEHNETSLAICASEVQKGNAVIERKIQRLFRMPEVSRLIKKCNDFGAGGVCVAIGELADGLEISLEKVRTKYMGLNATELAISESQERMAVVVDAGDVDAFLFYAMQENIEAYEVAVVTDTNRLVMKLDGVVVVDISRDFIHTNGAKQTAEVRIESAIDDCVANPFVSGMQATKETILHTLARIDVGSQKGMGEQFDASIGGTTVLMPYGGSYQLTPTQASVQKIPVADSKTTTCSVLAYGYHPAIANYSPFLSSIYAVIDSLAKIIAAGGRLAETHLSFQEYFERLEQDPRKWGKVTQAMLGAILAQDAFGCFAIGGKDSMSGTYQQLHVPPTLISFACGTANTKEIISNHFKQANNFIYLVASQMDENYYPDFIQIKHNFHRVEQQIRAGKVASAYVIEEGGIMAALTRMAIGEHLGFSIAYEGDLFALMPGTFLLETTQKMEDDGYQLLGTVQYDKIQVNGVVLSTEELFAAYLSPLQPLYPLYHKRKESQKAIAPIKTSGTMELPHVDVAVVDTIEINDAIDDDAYEVKVLIPVFPGTNCEYDTQRAFVDAHASCDIFVFNNLDDASIHRSIDAMVDKIAQCDIIALPGGFSSGDEPDGSAKYIVNILHNEKIKIAIHAFLDHGGLMLGICNGFQALVKSGLLPHGRIQTLTDASMTLFRNDISRHVSCLVSTRVASNQSPWLSSFVVGEVHQIPVSHGEGKLIGGDAMLQELIANNQVAFQYCDPEGNPTTDPRYNPNGSAMAIEGMVSTDGKILGKMGHSERYNEDVFINIPGNKQQNIFQNGVNYVKQQKEKRNQQSWKN